MKFIDDRSEGTQVVGTNFDNPNACVIRLLGRLQARSSFFKSADHGDLHHQVRFRYGTDYRRICYTEVGVLR